MAERRTKSLFSCAFPEGGILSGQILQKRATRRGILPLSLIEIETPHKDSVQMMVIGKPQGLVEFPDLFTFDGLSFASVFMSRWKVLHDAGLPVPHAIATVNPNEIAVFDPTNGGKYGFYSNIEAETILEANPNEHIELGTPQQIRTLLRMGLDSPDNAFVGKVDEVTRLATSKNICLSRVTPLELLVGPDDSWYLYILNCLEVEPSTDPNLALINHNLGIKFKSDILTTFYYLRRINCV